MYLQLNTNNKGLARLAFITSDEPWLSITAKQLPKSLRATLDPFFENIAGSSMEDDTVVLRVSFDKDDKTYNRCYPPAVYANESGEAVIVWGGVQYPITGELLELLDAEIEEVQIERYTEKCLVLNLEGEEEYISLPLPLKMTKETRDVDIKKLKKLLKDGKLDEFAAFLYIKQVKEPGSYTPTVKFTELPEMANIIIQDAELLDFPTHHNYKLTVMADGLAEAVQCWAPADVKKALDSGASIVPGETSFVYITKEGKNGKTRSYVTVNDLVWSEDDEMVRL